MQHLPSRTAVDRLVTLGATRANIGQGDVVWVVMADPDSPARGIKLSQTPKTDAVAFRPAELHRLVAALPNGWKPMVYVAGACGLRFSEVAGLRAGRLDLAHHRLQVIEPPK